MQAAKSVQAAFRAACFSVLFIAFDVAMPAAQTAPPVLYFSDIVGGPKSGNSDTSLGQTAGQDGAIVTVWGRNLDNADIYCNGARAAYYYFRGNATQPADLYAFHKMQTISFQVSHLANNGTGEIYAVVSGQQSNRLPFTVHSGNIYFVKTSGNDTTGNGSWTQPWRTIPKAADTLAPGDIAYIGNGVNQTTETAFSACVNLGTDGTTSSPKALVVYPGATSRVGNPNLERAFHIWNTDAGGYSKYWVLSKFTIATMSVGIFANTGFRVVGNRFTAPNVNGPLEGTLYAIGSDVYLLGNELYNDGTSQTLDKTHHIIYVTGVRQDDPPRAPTERNREIAWNYVHDNGTNRAIDIYSEQATSAYIQQHKVHDNVIVSQRGDGILLGYYVTGENWIYNNLIIRAGLGPEYEETTYHTGIHIDTGHENIPAAGTILHCYNNTLYGCGWSGGPFPEENGAILITSAAISRSTINFGNNIIYSTGDPYIAGESGSLPSANHRNCWFGQGAAPAWDTGAINVDPQFVGAGSNNLQLKQTSPCINRGRNVSSIVTRDLLGVTRPQGSAHDLGAYEFQAPQASVGKWILY
jgi:hypothetical protein